MAYVVTEGCTKDIACIDACPADCIAPRQAEAAFEGIDQVFVDPENCIDCGACVPVCPTGSIMPLEDVPAEMQAFVEKNAAYFRQ
ncbi:MAG: ferredoxin family protein [Bryobacteraceae bacterium]